MTLTLDQLDLLATDPTPLFADDKARIRAAVLADADTHGGVIDPNRVREALSNKHGLDVRPRLLSATYHHLRCSGAISPDGWTENTDKRGGNAGKPLRLYRLVNREAIK